MQSASFLPTSTEFEQVDKYFRSLPFPTRTKRLLDLMFGAGWVLGVWAAIDLALLALRYPQARGSPLLRDGLLACGSFVLLAAWSYARRYAVLQEVRRSRTRDLCTTTVSLQPEWVQVETERRGRSYRWREIAAVIKEKKHVLFLVRGELPFYVPERAFSNSEEFEAFAEKATESWRSDA